MRAATATAHANIALVKYWGKRDPDLNLPAAGSLSLTLQALTTTTTVEFDPDLQADRLILGGQPAKPAETVRTSRWLDLIRHRAGFPYRAHIESHNNFPTASGLASSASGFAALTVAAAAAAGWPGTPRELSIVARQGSGSAARSIFGGFVEMAAGDRADGSDAFAEPCSVPAAFVDDVRMVVAIVDGGHAKAHGSTDAMVHCAQTSPLYAAWIDQVPRDLVTARAALAAGDLTALGEVTEANALAMHASALAARPAIVYFSPTTIALLHRVRGLRADGLRAWATMDAGPHVKVLTRAADADAVRTALADVAGVTQVLTSVAGPAAHATTA